MSVNRPTAETPELTSADVRAKHREYLFPAVSTYHYREAIVPVEAKGLRVRDLDGREYLDFFGGILTVSVGHGNEQVNAAIHAQVDRLAHVVVALSDAAGGDARREAGGADARARSRVLLHRERHRGRRDRSDDGAGVHRPHRDHRAATRLLGPLLLAQSLTGHAPWRAVPSQVAAVKHAVSPYCYRCPLGLTYPSCGVQCAQRSRGADPHHHDRTHRRVPRRSRSRAWAGHHAAARVLPDRGRASCASTADCSSATRCRPDSGAPAAVVGHASSTAWSPRS